MNKKIVDGKEVKVEWADKGGPDAKKIKLPTYERIARVTLERKQPIEI